MVKKVDIKKTVPAPPPGVCSQEPDSGYEGAEFGFKPGEIELLAMSYNSPPKFPVGTSVPERIYREISRARLGISQFIEDAITEFDGDMNALVQATSEFISERKSARFDTGVRSISGRVSKAALTRLQEIVNALKDLPSMSIAKVLGGLVQLKLNATM